MWGLVWPSGMRGRNPGGAGGSPRWWRSSWAALVLFPFDAQGQQPPGDPASVSLTRADGTLTATWPAVSGRRATTSRTAPTAAQAGASPPPTIPPAGAATRASRSAPSRTARPYIVGVRAKNPWGGSGWLNSAPIDPYAPSAPDTPTGLTATAGDGSVTLTWDDPSNSTIAHYEYQSREAPPASGWGAWTTIPGSGATTTSHTFTGLTNGTEFRFKVRAVNAAGASGAAPNAEPWFVSATPQAPGSLACADAAASAAGDAGAYHGADARAHGDGHAGAGNGRAAIRRRAGRAPRASVSLAATKQSRWYGTPRRTRISRGMSTSSAT